MTPPIHIAVDRWIAPSGDVSTRVTATISPRGSTGYARVQIDMTKGGAWISVDERKAMLPVPWPGRHDPPPSEHTVDDVMVEAQAWVLTLWQQANPTVSG